jgi:carbon monoxide dehydrogenase subunit G
VRAQEESRDSPKGESLVRLEMVSDNSTVVHYDVEVQIAGKLAQLGARLIDSTAKKLAREFFTTFGEIVGMPVAQS